MKRACDLGIVIVLCAVASGNEGPQALDIPPADAILASLEPDHPRLYATAERFEEVRAKTRSDPLARRWFEVLRRRALALLDDPVSRYHIPDGKRLLSVSRRVLDRVLTLALVHRIDPDERFVRRAWRELEAAAKFPDWNPSHFLDTAEMTHAFAVGYDWLHDDWSPEQRHLIREALVGKGLEPARRCYDGRERYGWWVKARHNWNQVCNGGIGIGALAVGDEDPDLAGAVLHAALRSLPRAMGEYAPDGACPEGPGYWHYATRYTVYLIAALETALGTDFGIAESRGFADTGLFPIYLTAPSGRSFNFADCRPGTIRAEEALWLAGRFGRPEYVAYQRHHAEPNAFDLLWHDPAVADSVVPSLPLDRRFRGVEVATLRSAWDDPRAVFVGFKAGSNAVNHSNLDLGSFVLEALGQRWAIDPGPDDYNLPGYFDSRPEGRRWTYFRMRAEAHNAIVIDPGERPDQDPRAETHIVRFEPRPDHALAVADLTAAYATVATYVRRGIALVDRSWVLVDDRIVCRRPSTVWWLMHTMARIETTAGGREATLSLGRARLQATLLAPDSASFMTRAAGPLPGSPGREGQTVGDGVTTLAVRLDGASDVEIAVALVPQGKDIDRAPDARALDAARALFRSARPERGSQANGSRPQVGPDGPLVFSDDGAWCWFQDERAVMHDGKLIIGTVADGRHDPRRRGNVEVVTHDVRKGTTTREVLHHRLQRDDHASPAFLVREDGRLLALYTKHGNDNAVRHRLGEPGGVCWGEERVFVPSEPSRVTYSNPILLASENDGRGRLYNFFRGHDDSFKPSWMTSDDGGDTWRARGIWIDFPAPRRHRPYVKYTSDGRDEIHFAFTEGHPRDHDNSVYHAFYRDGAFYRSDGAHAGAVRDGPMTPEMATRVFRGDADNVAWTSDLHLDESGHPTLVYSVQRDSGGLRPGHPDAGRDHRYRYARWDGQRWLDSEVARGGSRLYPGEDDYTGNICIDPDDVAVVYFSTNVDPRTGAATAGDRHEIWRGVTADRGRTWSLAPVTRESRVDNLRPIVPASDGRYGALLWLRGRYESYASWDLQVVGVLAERR